MSLLSDLEKRFQSLTEGLFARVFGSSLQPVEVARRLQRHMDSHRVQGVGRSYVPNRYRVRIHPDDYASLRDYHSRVVGELESFALQWAQEAGYDIEQPVVVELADDASVARSQVEIDSHAVVPERHEEVVRHGTDVLIEATSGPHSGSTFPLHDGVFLVGRDPDADLHFPDSETSRRHARITVAGDHVSIQDIGSTNGTYVNGHRIEQATVQSGDRITIGSSQLVLRFVRRI